MIFVIIETACKRGKKMHIVIRDHILEGDNLDELAACLLRWMPPLVPWMLDLQKEVKSRRVNMEVKARHC